MQIRDTQVLRLDMHLWPRTFATIESNVCQNCCLYLMGVLNLNSNQTDSWMSRNLIWIRGCPAIWILNVQIFAHSND